MRADRHDAGRTSIDDSFSCLRKSACRIDHIVDEDGKAPRNVTDDVHLGNLIGTLATLVDHGDWSTELLSVGPRSLNTTRIRGDDHDVLVANNAPYLWDERWTRIHVVHRDIEEALNLASVKVQAEDPISAGDLKEVSNELQKWGTAAPPCGPGGRIRSKAARP